MHDDDDDAVSTLVPFMVVIGVDRGDVHYERDKGVEDINIEGCGWCGVSKDIWVGKSEI